MPKKRKTKKDKVKADQRRQSAGGFVINDEWLKTSPKKQVAEVTPSEKKFFKADLTKTLILTMLVLALELAIWNYLSRH